jgi:hypothetical protein
MKRRHQRESKLVQTSQSRCTITQNFQEELSMRNTFLLFAVGALIALGTVGCSKKSSSPTQTTTTTPPAFPTVSFSGPKTTSTDTYAAITQEVATTPNQFNVFFSLFAGANATQNGNSWVWMYAVSGFTVTFTETLLSDGSYTWKLVENGKEPGTNITYSNKTLFEGTRSADGKSGEWKFYYDTTAALLSDFTWATTGSGTSTTITGTMNLYDSSGAFLEQNIIKNNSDGSGEVDQYLGTVLTFKAVWAANGSGQWWTYDFTGVQSGTGTWT